MGEERDGLAEELFVQHRYTARQIRKALIVPVVLLLVIMHAGAGAMKISSFDDGRDGLGG